jgi:hypothetical protein
MRLICCCLVLLVTFGSQCRAETRGYVMYGLFFGKGLMQIADALRERGYTVSYGSYTQNRSFAADACAHRDDRIVVIGHSFGAERAAEVATQAAACGARDVTLIAVDPSAPATVVGVAHAVNFVGVYHSTITGAQNIPMPGYSHMGIMDSPDVQARILEQVEQGAAH